MKELTELPFDILNLIFILLATSANGDRALVRISTTCKKLKEHAEQNSVLKVVSFQGLRDDYCKHLHPRDLIFQCARVGNQAAECILGKAFPSHTAFLHILASNDQPTCEIIPASRQLNRHYYYDIFRFEQIPSDVGWI